MEFTSITRALLVRIIFTLHSIICIILLQKFSASGHFWFLTLTLGGLFMETLVIIIRRRGQEWMWFSPSIFFYLLSVVPAIWFMELMLITKRNSRCSMFTEFSNVTKEEIDKQCANQPSSFKIPIQIGSFKSIELDSTAQILEQFLLLLLIMGRWFMPKGKMSRDQLSQLLLTYIGVAADIVELFEAFKEQAVRESRLLTVLVLTVWSISLLQFCFILVTKTSKKAKSKSKNQFDLSKNMASKLNGGDTIYLSSISLKGNKRFYKKFKSIQWAFSLDVLIILIPLLFQDTPFIILRLYFIIEHKIISYTNTFFTAKNSLVILLLVYRLVVIQIDSRQKSKESSFLSSPMLRVINNVDRSQTQSVISNQLSVPHSCDPHTVVDLSRDEDMRIVIPENNYFSKPFNNIPRQSFITDKIQNDTYLHNDMGSEKNSNERNKHHQVHFNNQQEEIEYNKDMEDSIRIFETVIKSLS